MKKIKSFISIFLNIVQQILTAVMAIWCRPLIIMPQFQTALLHRFCMAALQNLYAIKIACFLYNKSGTAITVDDTKRI